MILPVLDSDRTQQLSFHIFCKLMLRDNRLRQMNFSISDLKLLAKLLFGGFGSQEIIRKPGEVIELSDEQWRPLEVICTNGLFIEDQFAVLQCDSFIAAIREAKTEAPS